MPTTLTKEDRFLITKDTDKAKKYFEDKLSFVMSPAELNHRLKDADIQVIDVRSREDYCDFHIKGAISMPYDDLENCLDKISGNKISVLYCSYQQCHLSMRAAIKLADHGFPCMVLEGGFKVWSQKAYPIERGLKI